MNIKKLLFRTNKKQLLALITICIVYGMHGTVFNSIPFIFYRPDIVCMKAGGVEYKCSEEEMCQLRKEDSSFSYRFDSYNNIRSISIEYDLFCERKFMEASMETLSTFGQLGGFILSLLWNVPTQKKFKVIDILNDRVIDIQNVKSINLKLINTEINLQFKLTFSGNQKQRIWGYFFKQQTNKISLNQIRSSSNTSSKLSSNQSRQIFISYILD